jgi:hypothetical protein
MKKVLLLTLLALLTLSSCSDSESIESDGIIGTWNPYYYTNENGERFPFSECIKKSTYIFKNGGIGTATGYDESGGDCLIEDEIEFQWSENGTKTYTLIINEDGDTWSIQFILNDNENEMTYYEDVGNGNTGYSETFKRR